MDSMMSLSVPLELSLVETIQKRANRKLTYDRESEKMVIETNYNGFTLDGVYLYSERNQRYCSKFEIAD